MRKFSILCSILAVTLVLFAAAPCMAGSQGDNYFGIGTTLATYSEAGASLSFSTLDLSAGSRLADNFAVEGRAGFGIAGDTYMGVDVKIDSYFGIYGKAYLAAGNTEPYAILGYTTGTLTLEAGGLAVSTSESSMSYGFGIDFQLNNGGVIEAEYAYLMDETYWDVTGFSVKYQMKF